MTQSNEQGGDELLDTILSILGVQDREVGNRPGQIEVLRHTLAIDRKQHELDAEIRGLETINQSLATARTSEPTLEDVAYGYNLCRQEWDRVRKDRMAELKAEREAL